MANLWTTDPDERLWARIVQDDECHWIWQGSLSQRGGYGVVSIGGGKSASRRSHQMMWEWFNGPVGSFPTEVLDHLCEVKACCNPGHLEIVTAKENTQRHFRTSDTHCAHGHFKMTQDQADRLNALRDDLRGSAAVASTCSECHRVSRRKNRKKAA